MSETYDEIINEIDRCKYVCDFFGAERNNCEICSQHENCFRSSSKSIAARVHEAVGGDPAEWWVLDADGNRVRIGDFVAAGGNRLSVIGFYSDGFITEDEDGDLARDHKNRSIKIIPDTREKIINDTLAKLDQTGMYRTSLVIESVEEAIDRAMKLAEVDA